MQVVPWGKSTRRPDVHAHLLWNTNVVSHKYISCEINRDETGLFQSDIAIHPLDVDHGRRGKPTPDCVYVYDALQWIIFKCLWYLQKQNALMWQCEKYRLYRDVLIHWINSASNVAETLVCSKADAALGCKRTREQGQARPDNTRWQSEQPWALFLNVNHWVGPTLLFCTTDEA